MSEFFRPNANRKVEVPSESPSAAADSKKLLKMLS